MAAVTAPSVGLGDIEALLRRLLPTAPVQASPPRPVPMEMEIMLECILLNAPATAPSPLYPLFATSPRSDGALPLISPITSPELPLLPASPAARFLPDEASESFDSAGVSPATSMSITDRTAELQLMMPSLIPLLETIQVQTNHSVPGVALAASTCSRGRPADSFDVSASPAATIDHLLITNQWDGDHSSLDSPFGVQVHHPQFFKWVGVPESARLLGRPPVEWLQVMTQQDTLHAALQLQRHASLMSSNLTVLHQYAISLHRTASEMLHAVFGREFFPSTAVNDATPVPRVLRASAHLAAMGLW